MKKIFLLIAMLALSTAGLVGCNSDKTRGMDLPTPENVSEIVQSEQPADCEDGDCNEPECPDCKIEEPDGNKIPEVPHNEHKKGHKHGHGQHPKPHHMPRRIK